ncbi:hypothetical protein CAP36_17000 [Chitinophagaceae bacterium IBVUCB2]|nr:hypothetical protein CAP36_17000 [Chitinophagaceae bacterium IBVUCB2]
MYKFFYFKSKLKMRILLIISLLIYMGQLHSQPIDSSNFKITYSLSYVTDTSQPNKVQTDLQTLLIGKHYTLTYSNSLFRRDSVIKNNSPDENTYINRIDSKSTNKVGLLTKYYILTSFLEKKITVLDQVGLDKYYYDELAEVFNWTIENDTASFDSYICQKAICIFRGRTYVAWFAKDIPISSGPYKFQGLPGLIIYVSDKSSNYTFKCVAIEKLSQPQPIEIFTKGTIKTSRKNFLLAQKNYFDNPWQSFKDKGIDIGGMDGEGIKNLLKTSRPYNPIELE